MDTIISELLLTLWFRVSRNLGACAKSHQLPLLFKVHNSNYYTFDLIIVSCLSLDIHY